MPMIRRPKRPLVWGFAALVVLALVFALWPESVPADFASVDRGSLRVTVDEEGETRVRDRFVVSAPVAGRVLRIDLEPGDAVVAGKTLLATFQPGLPALLDVRTRAEAEGRVNVARAALEQARAARERAQTERDFAESDLKRQRELDSAGLVSAEELDSAVSEARAKADALRIAESAIRTSQRELEVAQAALVGAGGASKSPPIVIRAPVTGVVLKRVRESEAVVPAGEPLLEIGDPKNLEIVSDLLSTDAVRISAGNTVLIDGWGGEGTLKGKVRRIEPSGFTKISALGVEEQRVNVIVDFDDTAVAGSMLGDGYRVEVRIVVWEKENVLKVPISSLFRVGDDWAIYVVRDGRAVQHTIMLGQRNSLEAEVLSGLQQGDVVIVHPSDAVEDGVRVSARA
jgi:HlyD family secretion protein